MRPGDETQPYQHPPQRPGMQDNEPTTPWFGGVQPPPGQQGQAQFSPPPPPSRTAPLVWLLLGACIILAVVLAGVLFAQHQPTTASQTTTAAGVPRPTSTPAITTPTTPAAVSTATPLSVGNCAALPAFAQASAATTGSRHVTVLFPAGSLSRSAGADSEANGFQQRALNVCTPSTSITAMATLGQNLTGAGWTALPPPTLPAEITCGSPCWRYSYGPPDPQSKGIFIQYVGVQNLQQTGDVTTYTLHLILTPFTSGTFTLDAATPTFSCDQSDLADLQFAGAAGVQLLDNALYAPLPGNDFAATYHQVQALSFSDHNGAPLGVVAGAIIALKGNDGRFAKLDFTQVSDQAITLQWITYPYGF